MAAQLLVVSNDLEVRRGFFFFFGCTSCGILLPQSSMKPGPMAVTILSLNHWTTREFPGGNVLSTGPPIMIVYHV